MGVDVEGLRRTIDSIKQQIVKQQIVGLDDDLARLERIVWDAEAQAPDRAHSATPDLSLPPEIVVRQLDAVAEYLRAHPGLVKQAQITAAVLLKEFRRDRSEIELVVYQDPEIDERQLVFYVRVAEYDDSFIPRLHTVVEEVERQLPPSSDWVLVTTDHRPIA